MQYFGCYIILPLILSYELWLLLWNLLCSTFKIMVSILIAASVFSLCALPNYVIVMCDFVWINCDEKVWIYNYIFTITYRYFIETWWLLWIAIFLRICHGHGQQLKGGRITRMNSLPTEISCVWSSIKWYDNLLLNCLCHYKIIASRVN